MNRYTSEYRWNETTKGGTGVLLALALGLLSVGALACLARSGGSSDVPGERAGLPLWARLAMR